MAVSRAYYKDKLGFDYAGTWDDTPSGARNIQSRQICGRAQRDKRPARFNYRLREGVSEQRLGMTLLRQEGVLDRLERSLDSGHDDANNRSGSATIDPLKGSRR